jgi:ADP-heptose:LPS heptosyltransferase
VCGPTDPRHTADHLERTSLLREIVECGPCHREQCPLEDTRRHQCMLRIDPERVARAAL